MRILSIPLVALALNGAALAQDGRFQVGQRVVQPTTRMTGVVTKIVPEAQQVHVQFDGRGAASAFFWGTPDLQPSNAPAPAQAQPGQGAQDGRFQVGQRVVQPTTRMTGVVTRIVPEAQQVHVQFDGREIGRAHV